MIQIIKGDLFKNIDKFQVLVHGCNCFNTMASGFAKQLASEYPQASYADYKSVKGDKKKLGHWSMAKVFPAKQPGLIIINAYTQFNYTRDKDVFEYEAWKNICKGLALTYSKKTIGMPKIGSGLAGGDWDKIYKIIEEELIDLNVLIFEL